MTEQVDQVNDLDLLDIIKIELSKNNFDYHIKKSYNKLFKIDQFDDFKKNDQGEIMDNFKIDKVMANSTPYYCRVNKTTYGIDIYADIHIDIEQNQNNKNLVRKQIIKQNVNIARIPIIVGMDKNNQNYKYEDKNDIPGYFIIKGNEWYVNTQESIAFNTMHVRVQKTDDELVRGLIISIRNSENFDNSYYVIMQILKDYQITFMIYSSKYKQIKIPFFILYKIFGILQDTDIIQTIVDLDDNSDLGLYIKNFVYQSFVSKKYKIFKNYKTVIDSIYNNSDEILKQLCQVYQTQTVNEKLSNITQLQLLQLFDQQLFPHMGTDPKDRINKLKYYGYQIRKLLQIYYEFQINPASVNKYVDKDHLKNKRIFPPGLIYSKAIKKNFNVMIFTPLIINIKEKLNSITNFNEINNETFDNVIQQIYPQKIEKILSQSISTGNSVFEIKNTNLTITNNLQSQDLARKNNINIIAMLRQVIPSNKTPNNINFKATDQRQVHTSFCGYICPIRTHDSAEKVGVIKSLALLTHINNGYSQDVIQKQILQYGIDDYKIILLENLPLKMFYDKLINKIYFNGKLIGVTYQNPYIFRQYYVELRRKQLIHKRTNISVDPISLDVKFFNEIGILLKPLIIVYTDNKGHQYIKLTKYHIQQFKEGKMKQKDFLKQQIIEYISPDEIENCLLCSDIQELNQDRLVKYTHLEIKQSLFGINALQSPFANHSQSIRITYFTNQSNQACGQYSYNFPYRYDKIGCFQQQQERPLVSTIIDDLTQSYNGQNIIIAYLCDDGYNQEDSIKLNRSSILRQLFNCQYFTFEQTELDKGERFCIPDQSIRNQQHDYSKLNQDGFIKVGSVIQKNTIIIGKIKRQIQDNQQIDTDESRIYSGNENGIIVDVNTGTDINNKFFCQVKILYDKFMQIGDKVSTRAGCKGIVGQICDQHEMPYTQNGLIPDIIFGPHSVPARMIVSQLIESILSKLAAYKSEQYDGTAFNNYKAQDIIQDIKEYLEKRKDDPFLQGSNEFCEENMYNPQTGQLLKAKIFICPMFYVRVLKFVNNQIYAISYGQIHQLTRQPLDGQVSRGGLRIGEMEKDVIASHGSMLFLQKKFTQDSDNFQYYLCRNCGEIIDYSFDKDNQKIYCQICQNDVDPVNIKQTTWMSVYLKHIINSLKINYNQYPQKHNIIQQN